MTLRRFNFTGRKRIPHRNAVITVLDEPSDGLRFSVLLDFEDSDLPDEARVVVEVFREMWLERVDAGSVKDVASEERELGPVAVPSELKGAVKYKIKVVDPRDGRLLAASTPITLIDGDTGRSILPVCEMTDAESDHLVWKLELDSETSDGPILYVTRPPGKQEVRSSYFQALVFPEVLRRVLTFIAEEDRHFDYDTDEWQHAWITFAARFAGGPGADTRGWIDDAVSAFAQHLELAAKYRAWFDERAG